MKTIYILRHCSTADSEKGINGSQTDTPLSDLGLLQAKQSISKISQYNYDLIFISPLQRTKQTIEPYLDTLKVQPEIIIEPLTIERDLGVLTNTITGDGKVPASMAASGKTKVEWIPEGGESTVMVYKRAKEFLEKLKSRNEQNILVCSHQNFLRCLELILTDQPIDDEHFYNENPPRLEPGEIRKYEF